MYDIQQMEYHTLSAYKNNTALAWLQGHFFWDWILESTW